MRTGLCAALALLLAWSALAGEKAAPVKNDWSGWWFVYHRNAKGKLVLDKFSIAMVIDDEAAKGAGKTTGQWIGCIWLPKTRIRYGRDSVALTFSPVGDKDYTFRMTRTGPDEAEGIYLDQPDVTYVAKRKRNHGECAGYEI